jgi:three-Cys-motif partner protein
MGARMPGPWTERKLAIVREYLKMYVQALKNQPFERIYIDAFSGTGEWAGKPLQSLPLLDLPGRDEIVKGSARLALEVEPPFDRYMLIERAPDRASKLLALANEYRSRNITVINGDANEEIKRLCQATNWRKTRGVVFLDPYGLQVSWDTLVAISRTGALDAWTLFPSGLGLNRLLTRNRDIPQEWQDTLDRSLGTQDWRTVFYASEENLDLFEGSQQKMIKDADATKLEKFYLERLETIFPFVWNKVVRLTNSKSQTMYLLCFTSANRSPKVRVLASKLVSWVTKA